VSDGDPGYRRQRLGRGFVYRDVDGALLRDARTLQRIRSLAIPPAYRQVWICRDPRGHLQATGVDARGRKQYRYHPAWRASRDRAKFGHLAAFARALPRLRRRIRRDLLAPGLGHDKVLAAVVLLLEETLIRVGNQRYARENRHYGLTTLRNHHVELHGAHLRFHFVGKSGVGRMAELDDRRLARVVRGLQELPGQRLFQFRDSAGTIHPITSGDVNAYLRRAMRGDFSAKDFRTWAATVFCAVALVQAHQASASRPTAAELARAIRRVAQRLGNTPAVCRKCYVHPRVIEGYLADGLRSLRWGDREASALGFRRHLHQAESAVIAFLEPVALSDRPNRRRLRPRRWLRTG
jgi:DNA topoisomerase-1